MSCLLRSRSAITVALQAAIFPALDTPKRHLRLVRPRSVHDAGHAVDIIRRAETGDRSALPRWGINSPIRDHGASPGVYTGSIGWTSRTHYLMVTVPAVVLARPDVLKAHHVEVATFLRWITRKTLYAQDQTSGRTVIVRPDTIAGLMLASESTAHRCQRVARQLGLELVVVPGRMLTEIESHRARKAGSPQRGLSTVSAFTIPSWLSRPVVHDTPTRGTSFSSNVADIFTFNHTSGRPKSAPLRSAPHRQTEGRTRSPAWPLAKDLTERAIFLNKCPPGRIAGQLRRYQSAPLPWRATQILQAMDNINIRLGYTAPVRAKQAPWALLAWYLHQIDPVADHPDFDGAFAS